MKVEEFLKKIDVFHQEISDLCNAHPAPTDAQRKKIIRISKMKHISTKDAEKAAEGWHAPGADGDCEHCKPIIAKQEEMEAFEKENLGMTRSERAWKPGDIKFVRGVIKMLKEEGEL